MTTVEHAEFASPLSLVEHWGERGDGAPLRELLILGYTVDLAFLERFCVPRARQLGARITVLSDADHVLHDAVDVRLAGSAYQFGTASIAGAFHPKLALLVGDDDVWAAVGSGNPTLSGWSHNRELWCVLRGRSDEGLRAQADLGEWRRLPVAVPSSSPTTGACPRPSARTWRERRCDVTNPATLCARSVRAVAVFPSSRPSRARATADRRTPVRPALHEAVPLAISPAHEAVPASLRRVGSVYGYHYPNVGKAAYDQIEHVFEARRVP